MSINNQRDYFNKSVNKWIRDISSCEEDIIIQSFNNLEIAKGDDVLDVGCGTGVLYDYLQRLNINKYVGIDISEKMLEQFTSAYPHIHVIRTDFNHKIEEDYGLYDYIIIYNSIPHFDQLENVFYNARHLLKQDGVFSIIHARSRKGLKEHHKKIGYIHSGDPIPSNQTLMRLSEDYGMKNVRIEDDNFFYFSCSK